MTRNIYSRWQSEAINKSLRSRRVLILVGPRQCGKTTLAKNLATKNVIYRTLDDATLLAAAQTDPNGFIAHGNDLMIIDEVQRAPLLLQAIKKDVDVNQKNGRFLLTGSANIQSLPGVTESLAGRVSKIRLRPLSRGEILSTKPDFFEMIFAKKLQFFSAKNYQLTKSDYLKLAFKGGYPEALRLKEKESKKWHRDYLNSLIERDLKDIINIKRQDSMQKLLEILAAWSSKFMDISAIGSGLGLARQTVESYINALEALYLVERVRPWSKTDYDRVSKQDKLFMTDSGLMVSILRWQPDQIQFDGEKNGKLIETFIFTQLAAIVDASKKDYELFHYRDREKREIDFIIENEKGDIIGIEVKAGSTVDKSSFKHLSWFKENMAKNQKFIGIVLYTGENVLSFGKDLFALPISCIWDS
jgi:predicted AAA+ superfamily ATPase